MWSGPQVLVLNVTFIVAEMWEHSSQNRQIWNFAHKFAHFLNEIITICTRQRGAILYVFSLVVFVDTQISYKHEFFIQQVDEKAVSCGSFSIIRTKKLGCHRETARRFLLSHSKSVKVIQDHSRSFEMTLLSMVSLLVFHCNYV